MSPLVADLVSQAAATRRPTPCGGHWPSAPTSAATPPPSVPAPTSSSPESPPAGPPDLVLALHPLRARRHRRHRACAGRTSGCATSLSNRRPCVVLGLPRDSGSRTGCSAALRFQNSWVVPTRSRSGCTRTQGHLRWRPRTGLVFGDNGNDRLYGGLRTMRMDAARGTRQDLRCGRS